MPGKGLEPLRLQRRHLNFKVAGGSRRAEPQRDFFLLNAGNWPSQQPTRFGLSRWFLWPPRGPDDPARTECSISWSILQQESLESGNSLSARRLAGTPAPHPFWMIAWD